MRLIAFFTVHMLYKHQTRHKRSTIVITPIEWLPNPRTTVAPRPKLYTISFLHRYIRILATIKLQALDQLERELETTTSAPPDNTTLSIAHRLMTPDQALYSNQGETVTLTIIWAIGIAGLTRFHHAPFTNGRYLLRLGDDLALDGKRAGLSHVVLDWLEHGEDTLILPSGHLRS